MSHFRIAQYFVRLIAAILPLSGIGQTWKNLAPIDREWAEVLALASPVPARQGANYKAKTREEAKIEIELQSALQRQAARRAREFYLNHPDHPKALEARKVEALAALRGIQDGDSLQEQTAIATAKAYRDDKTRPEASRFQVAVAMEQLDLAKQMKSKAETNKTTSSLALADKLKAEFGDIPALQDYYLELARTIDGSMSPDLATKIAQSTTAAPTTKAEANALLMRQALLGKRMNLKLPRVDGGEVDLGNLLGKLTIVFICSPHLVDNQKAVSRYKKDIPSNAQLVYVWVGETTEQAGATLSPMPIKGLQCRIAPGTPSGQVGETLGLRNTIAPYVYLIGTSGTLIGFGRANELPDLLALARLPRLAGSGGASR